MFRHAERREGIHTTFRILHLRNASIPVGVLPAVEITKVAMAVSHFGRSFFCCVCTWSSFVPGNFWQVWCVLGFYNGNHVHRVVPVPVLSIPYGSGGVVMFIERPLEGGIIPLAPSILFGSLDVAETDVHSAIVPISTRTTEFHSPTIHGGLRLDPSTYQPTTARTCSIHVTPCPSRCFACSWKPLLPSRPVNPKPASFLSVSKRGFPGTRKGV